MKHCFRFLGVRTSEKAWELSPSEQNHLQKVLRLKEGESFEVCNQRGWIASCTHKVISKSVIELNVTSESFQKYPPFPCHLLLGVIANKDFDEILPALVEIGISSVTVFGQPGIAKNRLNRKQDRLERIIDSAVKQCKTGWRMGLEVKDSLESALDGFVDQKLAKFFLDASAEKRLGGLALSGQGALLVVGGEAGLLACEIDTLTNMGFRAAHLGPNILRARTAAVVAPWEILSRQM